ncbi:anti-sigma-K factor RskA [Sphingomonas zeicaulis]|uniref:anti-sigma factor n=1 Tax=Sphingomonas zeicaulis TaxID=1632740 RepID=UPI003D2014A3
MADALPGEDPDMLAAELALGVLDGPERAAALRRLLADPAFGREVDDWRERLAPLIDTVPEQAPPATLWQRIEKRIDGGGEARALKASVTRWRSFTAAASLVAASAIGWIAINPAGMPDPVLPPAAVERSMDEAGDAELAQREPPPAVAAAPAEDAAAAPMMIAQLAPPERQPMPMAMAAVMPDGALKIAPGPMAGEGKSAELWVIPAGGQPVSLGLVRPGEMNTLTIRAEIRPMINGEATLAISIEPSGGSPTGQPTGPVVAAGRVTRI